MSDMPGNPHYELANGGVYSPMSSDSEATLALAYEQRTANLLALLLGEGPLTGIDYLALLATVSDRMGLTKGASNG